MTVQDFETVFNAFIQANWTFGNITGHDDKPTVLSWQNYIKNGSNTTNGSFVCKNSNFNVLDKQASGFELHRYTSDVFYINRSFSETMRQEIKDELELCRVTNNGNKDRTYVINIDQEDRLLEKMSSLKFNVSIDYGSVSV